MAEGRVLVFNEVLAGESVVTQEQAAGWAAKLPPAYQAVARSLPANALRMVVEGALISAQTQVELRRQSWAMAATASMLGNAELAAQGHKYRPDFLSPLAVEHVDRLISALNLEEFLVLDKLRDTFAGLSVQQNLGEALQAAVATQQAQNPQPQEQCGVPGCRCGEPKPPEPKH